MKVSRSIGGLLLLLVAIFFTNKYIEENTYANQSSSDGIVAYDLTDTNLDDSSEDKIITYTNKNNYRISLNESNVVVNCIGTGSSKEDDEALVKRNLKVSVYYSKNKKDKVKDINVEKDEMVYIHVLPLYEGKEKPKSEVTCNYSINIQTAI